MNDDSPEDAPRSVGRTKTAGWQVGARRTLDLNAEEAWRLVTSADGVRAWLGERPAAELEPGARYRLSDGSEGEVRVWSPGSHLRLTWQPPGWERASTIQLRVLGSGARAVVALHQEHLPDERTREARRTFFAGALDRLAALAAGGDPSST
ncbi:MAG: hypothetical protein JWM27_1104 [Gemmatimonadetes bacterium]|nr:hypothetical protein [Gemmatimonadota bacterium]